MKNYAQTDVRTEHFPGIRTKVCFWLQDRYLPNPAIFSEADPETSSWMFTHLKVKWSRHRPGVAQRVTAALEGGEWSAARPGRTLPPGRTRYPFYRRLGEPQGRSGQGRKISSPPGFDPGPSSPVAQSLYRLSYRATFTRLMQRNKWKERSDLGGSWLKISVMWI